MEIYVCASKIWGTQKNKLGKRCHWNCKIWSLDDGPTTYTRVVLLKSGGFREPGSVLSNLYDCLSWWSLISVLTWKAVCLMHSSCECFWNTLWQINCAAESNAECIFSQDFFFSVFFFHFIKFPAGPELILVTKLAMSCLRHQTAYLSISAQSCGKHIGVTLCCRWSNHLCTDVVDIDGWMMWHWHPVVFIGMADHNVHWKA